MKINKIAKIVKFSILLIILVNIQENESSKLVNAIKLMRE